MHVGGEALNEKGPGKGKHLSLTNGFIKVTD